MSKQRRALVTGATGGLGMALVPALIEEGYCVRATGRNLERIAILTDMGVEVVPVDLLQPNVLTKLCNEQKVVFHLAALSSPWGSAISFQRINVETTSALLTAAQKAGCDSFIFTSSPSVYAARRDQLDLTEADPPEKYPLNHYARTKAMAETYVKNANGPSMATVSLRPRAIVGPYDTVILPRLIELAQRGRVPLLRGGEALIELTDARDVARALIAADKKREQLAGQVVNISGGQPIPVRHLAGEIAKTLQLPIRFRNVPFSLVYAVAGCAELVSLLTPGRPEPVITRYTATTMAYSLTFDMDFANNTMGFHPVHDAFETLLDVAREQIKGSHREAC